MQQGHHCTKMTHLCLKGIRRLPTERGEPVTFCSGAGFMHHRTGVQQARQGQTKRRKKPVLMRFLQGIDNFHEKITFSYSFVHTCCIHPHMVDNSTGGKQVFRDRKQQRVNAFQGSVKTFKGDFSTLNSRF
jgi:hypothetical protein